MHVLRNFDFLITPEAVTDLSNVDRTSVLRGLDDVQLASPLVNKYSAYPLAESCRLGLGTGTVARLAWSTATISEARKAESLLQHQQGMCSIAILG